ncbi:chemotaxis protein CheA [Sphingopyxis yananensis]|uniref:chemotaxis protein CheA n=1 Tax=Sphingopyxis yananensis TaxID=2886687 RepID=UPI001D1189F7|nr:chemotaxis protein CheA [Sphingopyxis yananensis]MCC2602476.1 chemotaxis protein CheA [Sphingopyxis yananensis]
MTNEEIQAIYLQECEEGLGHAEAALLDIKSGQYDAETINSIFRAVHSIKGGAGAFGFADLQSFTHHFETLLDKVRDGDVAVTPSLVDLLMAAFDMLADHVGAISGENAVPDDAAMLDRLQQAAVATPDNAASAPAEAAGTAAPDLGIGVDLGFDLSAMMAEMNVLAEDVAMSAESDAVNNAQAPAADWPADLGSMDLGFDLSAMMAEMNVLAEDVAMSGDSDADSDAINPPDWILRFAPTAADMMHGGDPLLLVRELCRLGGSVRYVDLESLPPLEHFDADEAYVGWTIHLPHNVAEQRILEIFDFIADPSSIDLKRAEPADWNDSTSADNNAPNTSTPDSNVDDTNVADISVLDGPSAARIETPQSAALPPVLQPASPPQRIMAAAVEPPVAVAAPAPAPAPAPTPSPPSASSRSAPAAPSAPKAAASATIRVELEKLDRLVNLVGELVITQSMLSQRLLGDSADDIQELTDLDHLTRELQDSAMALRAQPVKSVFSRVPRIVRELEASTGKRVILEVEGEATELDKTVIERLGEPLTHLIRNSVDHGIEMPDDRLAKGKPAEGTVRLAAEHKSGRIVITVADDGAGINRERVLAIATERGIVTPDMRLSDEEIDNLIFAPGFSTAKSVSNISGRGVGMDVVRQGVHALGGRVTIESKPGRGSVFTLALPLTLAIADGMIVSVGEENFIVPLTHVIESLRPEVGAVEHTGFGHDVLNVRGAYLPVMAVGDQLGVPDAITDPSQAVLIIVDTESAGQAILMVDAIVDQRQVVIKSLETHYQPVEGVSGATILGDGRVALILDVESLVALRAKDVPRQWAC